MRQQRNNLNTTNRDLYSVLTLSSMEEYKNNNVVVVMMWTLHHACYNWPLLMLNGGLNKKNVTKSLQFLSIFLSKDPSTKLSNDMSILVSKLKVG